MVAQEHSGAGENRTSDGPGGGQPSRVVRDLHGTLSVRITDSGRWACAVVAGEVDHGCAHLMEGALRDALAGSPGGLRLDLGAVSFCDCAALNSLLRLHRLAHESGRVLTVSAVSRTVDRLLTLTGTRVLFLSGGLSGGLSGDEGAGHGPGAPAHDGVAHDGGGDGDPPVGRRPLPEPARPVDFRPRAARPADAAPTLPRRGAAR